MAAQIYRCVNERRTVLSDRNCGDCTACCDGWLSAATLEMRPGKPCKNRCDAGCGIYEDRPEDPCRLFRCGWLQGVLPDDESWRPDKSGAILLTGRGPTGWKSAWRLVPTGICIEEDALEGFKELAVAASNPLIWIRRQEDFSTALNQTVHRYAIGPADFLSALKWDFSDDDVWDLAPGRSEGP